MNPEPESQPVLIFSTEELQKAEAALASSLAELKGADAVSFFSTVIDFETGLRRGVLTQKQQRIFTVGEQVKTMAQDIQKAEQSFSETMKTAQSPHWGLFGILN